MNEAGDVPAAEFGFPLGMCNAGKVSNSAFHKHFNYRNSVTTRLAIAVIQFTECVYLFFYSEAFIEVFKKKA